MSMFMLQATADLFALFFVLPCGYAYVAHENQAIKFKGCVKIWRKAFKLTLMPSRLNHVYQNKILINKIKTVLNNYAIFFIVHVMKHSFTESDILLCVCPHFHLTVYPVTDIRLECKKPHCQNWNHERSYHNRHVDAEDGVLS